MSNLPLQGVTVLEFSQYLSGPSAGLRLADLGARVIKIERPGSGDACRQLAIKNLWAADGSSLLFHTINRNKESFAANLKNPTDLELIKLLIEKADVVTHNFRPGVMEKVGLGYEDSKVINPAIIYAEISGYGTEGPWKDLPGQDLLLQAISGLTYTTGNEDDLPVPFGIAIADIICGSHLTQGVLAALIRRQKRGVGARIEVNLLASLLDFQFELFTTYFASKKLPQRTKTNNGHTLLSAPYGVYQTADGYIALAMVELEKLSEGLNCRELLMYKQEDAFALRNEIKELLALHLKEQTSLYWLELLHSYGIWAMPVMSWKEMKAHPAYQSLLMEQKILAGGNEITTTRCPIRFNHQRLFSTNAAPGLGEHNQTILQEFKNVRV
ncbi:MAG TPA: CaiB/BaiF CoA-transferase family protein [Flavisolibacter sp.]|nr:CaiB/BaiF CoA-transferase family protein [Flavisolibacter sp.]